MKAIKILGCVTLWAAGIFLIVLTSAYSVQACGDDPLWEFRVAAGKQGQLLKPDTGHWEGSSNIAAVFALSRSAPLFSDWLRWDIILEHHSQWDRGYPVNNKTEDELDSLTVGLRVRLDDDW